MTTVAPEQTCSWVGRLLYGYISPVIDLSRRVNRVPVDDMPPLLDSDKVVFLRSYAFKVSAIHINILVGEAHDRCTSTWTRFPVRNVGIYFLGFSVYFVSHDRREMFPSGFELTNVIQGKNT